MPITVQVPSALRGYNDGSDTLEVDAIDVRSALRGLAAANKPLYRNICDESGAVRRHLNLFVNGSHIRDLAGVDSALKDGDALIILTAVSGG